MIVGEKTVAHVGYPLVVRGRDFEHVGVMWPENLVRRGDEWHVDKALIFGSDLASTMAKAKSESSQQSPYHRQLANALAQSIRILLTRATRTVGVWIEDEATRDYVREQWDLYVGSDQ